MGSHEFHGGFFRSRERVDDTRHRPDRHRNSQRCLAATSPSPPWLPGPQQTRTRSFVRFCLIPFSSGPTGA